MPRPRVLSALLIIALALLGPSLTACDGDSPTQPLPDGATLVADAATAMAAVNSAHVVLEIQGQVANPPLPLSRAEGDLTRAGDAQGTLLLSQLGALIEYEFVLVGKTVYLKGITGGWQQLPAAMATTIYDPSAILNPDRGVAKVLATASEATTEAREPVNGVDTYRVAAKLDSVATAGVVPGIATGVTAKLWLDVTSKRLVRAVLTVPGSPGGTVTINASAFDVPVTISAPI